MCCALAVRLCLVKCNEFLLCGVDACLNQVLHSPSDLTVGRKRHSLVMHGHRRLGERYRKTRKSCSVSCVTCRVCEAVREMCFRSRCVFRICPFAALALCCSCGVPQSDRCVLWRRSIFHFSYSLIFFDVSFMFHSCFSHVASMVL